MTRIKICGITTLEGGLAALEAGADYLGFVFYPPSPRVLNVEHAAELIEELRAACPGGWLAVGVFVNESTQYVAEVQRTCGLDVVQLNGEEGPDYIREMPVPVFKALRTGGAITDDALGSIAEFGAQRLLVDANVDGEYGGTGVSYDWTGVRSAVADGFLAGGLTPENVTEALAAASPWGVDVSSGVEVVPGTKSPELIRAFIQAVRASDRTRIRS